MNQTRVKIGAHLALSSKFDMAAKKILENNLDIKEIASNYAIDLGSLSKKIRNKKCKKQFYQNKSKYELAMKEVIENKFSYNAAARKYGINKSTLFTEIRKVHAQGSGNYTYDRAINPKSTTSFTYLQDELLLNDLKKWERETWADCTCQLCALEELSILAYKYVIKDKRMQCPISWIVNNRADDNWLIEFEMRHSEEISAFKSFETCFKETLLDC